MGILINKRFATAKQMRMGKMKNSPVMKKLLENERVSKVLDKKAERIEFYEALKNKKAGGITMNEVKEVLGDFRSGKGKTIDKGEAMKLANEIIPNKGYFTKKYIFNSSKKNGTTQGGFRTYSRTNTLDALKSRNDSGNEGIASNRFTSGSDQMRSGSNSGKSANLGNMRPRLFS